MPSDSAAINNANTARLNRILMEVAPRFIASCGSQTYGRFGDPPSRKIHPRPALVRAPTAKQLLPPRSYVKYVATSTGGSNGPAKTPGLVSGRGVRGDDRGGAGVGPHGSAGTDGTRADGTM